LTLLLSTQLPPPHGLSRSSIYISTESGLPTTRLTQLLNNHPTLSSIPVASRPSLSHILAIRVQDLEEQDHILAYQLPVAIKRHNAGLVIIDSVTANFRAEHAGHQAKAMASRSTALVKLGHMLRKLAREENVAVVVANQVSDRFEAASGGRVIQDSMAGRSSSPLMASFSSPAPQLPLFGETEGGRGIGEEVLSLDHQQRFFSGWGDESFGEANGTLKTPALGLVWTNQIACRIALKMASSVDRKNDSTGNAEAGRSIEGGQQNAPRAQESYIWSERKKMRVMRVVFAPWVAGSKERLDKGDGPEFEILREGIKAVVQIDR
jgi:DNA repair protein RAD57